MANPMRGEVPFECEGRSYRLSFSVNALCALEDRLGQGITSIIQMLGDPAKLRLSQVRAVFWAGLQDHYPDLTVEDAGRMMTAIGNVEAIDMIGKAFSLSFPQQDGGGGRPLAKGTKPQAGTGKRS